MWIAEKMQALKLAEEKPPLLGDLELCQHISVRATLVNAIDQLGHRHLTGKPPQGAMEELLQASIGKK